MTVETKNGSVQHLGLICYSTLRFTSATMQTGGKTISVLEALTSILPRATTKSPILAVGTVPSALKPTAICLDVTPSLLYVNGQTPSKTKRGYATLALWVRDTSETARYKQM